MTDALYAERAIREHACPEHSVPRGVPCMVKPGLWEPALGGGALIFAHVYVCPTRVALVQQRGPEPAEGNERAAGVAHSVYGGDR